ncbi:MAG: phosphoenolpyruvate carboxykinase (GTP) [Vicinamibacteria bacterium]|jgi:phosphoenolpyruvate carboxykinase (GTP)|nr:phosphoenolpyruvate carboxykinase (GTP) [Vicinamibacteria bacterium]
MKPVERWVAEVEGTTHPDRVVWCDGSEAENEKLIEQMLKDGTLSRLNAKEVPGCVLHRSHPLDVARTEHLTFISTPNAEDVGPTNNWISSGEARQKVGTLFNNVMRGRTMYVVPYVMGPLASPFSKVGIEITDSPYVVANMRIVTRMGRAALERLGGSADFVPGLHSTGDLSPDRRFIVHFPEERLIWSVGSGYGGNALLGKKCFALRIASVLGRDEGWLAEHMLILELTLPSGESHYIAAAFPSACGKTNLAMLVSPLEQQGYKVRTLGDDIAWLRPGSDGRLWAINPEAGFFGVVPGTNNETNPNAMATMRENTIYTNVAVSRDGVPWWEGKDGQPPADLIDWHGQAWDRKEKAAHPNSRFTAPARNCPSMSPRWEDPQGVPLSAIIFGARRAHLTPLVIETHDWEHGVFAGATMGSETTAAQSGAVGVVRRDPMAMLPFCGYNMADYFGHWLKMRASLTNPPKIFRANWFRTDADGRFLWPGFGQNVRVLIWIVERLKGKAQAQETPIGFVPTPSALNLEGLSIPKEKLDALLAVSRDEWDHEVGEIRAFFERFGNRLPPEMNRQLQDLTRRVREMR